MAGFEVVAVKPFSIFISNHMEKYRHRQKEYDHFEHQLRDLNNLQSDGTVCLVVFAVGFFSDNILLSLFRLIQNKYSKAEDYECYEGEEETVG